MRTRSEAGGGGKSCSAGRSSCCNNSSPQNLSNRSDLAALAEKQ